MTRVSKEDRHKIGLLHIRMIGFTQSQRRMLGDRLSVSSRYITNLLSSLKVLTGRETFVEDEIFSQELELLFPFRQSD